MPIDQIATPCRWNAWTNNSTKNKGAVAPMILLAQGIGRGV